MKIRTRANRANLSTCTLPDQWLVPQRCEWEATRSRKLQVLIAHTRTHTHTYIYIEMYVSALFLRSLLLFSCRGIAGERGGAARSMGISKAEQRFIQDGARRDPHVRCDGRGPRDFRPLQVSAIPSRQAEERQKETKDERKKTSGARRMSGWIFFL